MGKVEMHGSGAVLPFPCAASRPHRQPLSPDEPRGEILLFTGVRYERLPDPSHPVASDGQPRGRRRRRS